MSETNSGFDYNTSVKDPKTGKVIGENHYKLNINKNDQGGVEHKIEQPIGSGNFFHANGEKIIIQGDTKKSVPVDAEGKTEEEFNSDLKQEQKAPKGDSKKDHK
jgi:hypothetical protein